MRSIVIEWSETNSSWWTPLSISIFWSISSTPQMKWMNCNPQKLFGVRSVFKETSKVSDWLSELNYSSSKSRIQGIPWRWRLLSTSCSRVDKNVWPVCLSKKSLNVFSLWLAGYLIVTAYYVCPVGIDQIDILRLTLTDHEQSPLFIFNIKPSPVPLLTCFLGYGLQFHRHLIFLFNGWSTLQRDFNHIDKL